MKELFGSFDSFNDKAKAYATAFRFLQAESLRFTNDEIRKRGKEKSVFGKRNRAPQIYYIWGHSYELDVSEKAWFDFEKLCEYLAGKNNVFYGTNDEVFSEFSK